MTLMPIICYRCSQCNRIYEEQTDYCICERQVFIEGERFGPFIVIERLEDNNLKVKCILCDTFTTVHAANIRRQQSCGCKPKHVEKLDLTSEVLVYRCRKCGKTRTVRLPVVSYCCEGENE